MFESWLQQTQLEHTNIQVNNKISENHIKEQHTFLKRFNACNVHSGVRRTTW